jgi:RecB family exonuclease
MAVARQLKADRRRGEGCPLERTAVVYKRPLPYLYLAAEVFASAAIPYQTSDALPLAVEPTAAAIDLVFEAVVSDFTRESLVALLGSPHFSFGGAGTAPAIRAMNRALSDARYLGGLDQLDALGATLSASGTAALAAAARPLVQAAVNLARELAPLADRAPASVQIARALAFWQGHLRPIADGEPFAERERRARAAIVDTLTALAAAHAAYDDPLWTVDDLALAVKRRIEEQTFDPAAPTQSEPSRRRGGVHLLDDRAARYGAFDDIRVVGVVEPDWPERPRRNIFYPPAVLRSLGWPSEKDRRAAADAYFLDLLGSATRRTRVSVFTLEDDSLVSRSLQLDEIARSRWSTVADTSTDGARVFVEEALYLEPFTDDPLDVQARVWAAARRSRASSDAAKYHGSVGTVTDRTWSVSALEAYLHCPFKFFAQQVLKLEEEPDDEEVMDPRREGRLVHEIFRCFFSEWQRIGHGAVRLHNLQEARALFAKIVDRTLLDLRLSDAEAGLQRARLMGSPAATGLGEAVMRMEAERADVVVERMLEHEVAGDFAFVSSEGPRTVALRGRIDRLDLLEDGTFRLIDYKLGWPPDRSQALQLPIYGICAERSLSTSRGGAWTLGEAAYVAFKGPKRIVPLFRTMAERDEVLAKAQQRLVDVADNIRAGRFPPAPDDIYRCESCSFGPVCRKDYVGDV